MGGEGQIVEADETYYGPVKQPRTRAARGAYTKGGKTGPSNKRPIVAMVELLCTTVECSAKFSPTRV